ncbi:MAG: hypothetical protein QOG67_3461 [Verrucomicrobiota bacterium]|jgi:uncharacterized membrane protein YoaK (UPF0700 family)
MNTLSPAVSKDIRVRDLLLNALTFSSGAIDAISFIALGKVFTAFMTGNIAFLGLRIAGAGGPGCVAILVSMAAFSIGVYFGTRIVKPRGHKGAGVWPHRVTIALGLSLLGHAGFLVLWFAFRGRPSNDVAHLLLGLWGFAMGMQSAAVRSLHVDGVFTTAATATFIFVMGDFVNWSESGDERRRLWGVLIFLFLGALTGGLLLVHAHIYAPVLSFVATVFVVVTAAIAFRNRAATENATAPVLASTAFARPRLP